MTYSEGIFAKDSNGVLTVAALTGKDFLVAKAESPIRFTQDWINLAYAAKVPFIMFYEWDMSSYMEIGQNADGSRIWPAPDVDENIHLLDEYIGFTLGKPIFRTIHGIMLSFESTKFTPYWIKEIAERAMKIVWDRYKIPLYFYINENSFKMADANGKQMINNLTGKQEGVSVPFFSTTALSPLISFDYQKWFFWLYKVNTNGTLGVKYSADKAALYAELAYAPQTTPPPVVITPPEEEVPVEEGASLFTQKLERSIKAFCIEFLK